MATSKRRPTPSNTPKASASTSPSKPTRSTGSAKPAQTTKQAKPVATKKGPARSSRVTKKAGLAAPDILFSEKKSKGPAWSFVLDELDELGPHVRPMFGSHAVYIGEQFMFILHNKEATPLDNGVWLATSQEHHESLREEFPGMRSIALFQTEVTSWQVLPCSERSFESWVLRACELIRQGDPRIGKIPAKKRSRKTRAV